MTYNLMVSCPRMEWYILLASVRGFSITTEIMRSNIRKRSAFCDGGSGGAEDENRLATKRKKASIERIGKMVNVYRKESRHKINPKPMILKQVRVT